jgi:hypothetical protein
MKKNKWLYEGAFKEMKGIILEARSGAKKAGKQRNPDYKLLLRYVIETLKNQSKKSVEIYIASVGKAEAKYLSLLDRLLVIDEKSKIDFTTIDVDDFITKLSKEIKFSGQTGNEKGGNSTKRLFFNIKESVEEISPNATLTIQKQRPDFCNKEQVLKTLESFSFDFKRTKKTKSSDIKALVTDLQNNLRNHLQTCFTNFNWQIEYKANPNRKDSFDIYGYDKARDVHIVIELDPHRADSIAKKFVSRLALMVNSNLLYVAYLYPGTDKMPKNEAKKYLLDCETILNVLNSNSSTTKEFLGYYLEQ